MSYLKITFGPMFSGKTTDILTNISRLSKTVQGKILIINSDLDIRNNLNNINNLTSHSQVLKSIIENENIIFFKSNNLLFNLKKKIKEIKDIKIIIIDECQFYSDLFNFVKDFLLRLNVNIYCYGLISDYKMQKFGNVYHIMCLADDIEMKHSLCKKCIDEGKSHHDSFASFTVKKESREKEIGGDDLYYASCRRHFQIIS